MSHTVANINDPPQKEQLWFNKAGDPVESYLVTDMQFHKGRLYTAGLSSNDAAASVQT